MIKFIVGIICYYILYCSYHVYENIRTPIYDHTRDIKNSKKQSNNNNLYGNNIYKPFKNVLTKKDKIDYHIYLSCVEDIDLNKYIDEKYIDYDRNFIKVFYLKNARYNWDESQINQIWKWIFFSEHIYPSVDIVIPKRLINMNKNIYMHIITYYDDDEGEDEEQEEEEEEEEEEEVEEEDRERKNKIEGGKNVVKKVKMSNSLYIPKRIRFGPVIEFNDININKLGFFSNVFVDKSTNTYLLPTYFNNHLTPEDEYELLLKERGVDDDEEEDEEEEEEEEERKGKHGNRVKNGNHRKRNNPYRNNKHVYEITVEYAPISYTYFNLYNIIIFNMNHLKEKYSYTSYDLDSLTIFLCGNIYLCVFIYIICIIHIILNIIALLFNIESWNKLNDLYSFLPNTTYYKLFFTFCIFLYLKNKNSCKILMVFCVLKMAVCIWKVISKYDIHFLPIHPYVYIGNNKPSIENKNLNVDVLENKIKMKIQNFMISSIILILTYNFLYNLMPTIHKFKAFGDDIIFLIFLVQYCVYKKGQICISPPQGGKVPKESKKKK
ncbi:serpentine receptor 1 [Plasmodium brasilianum]|uniref:Serpentine receptor 1 n=1 Tax=Plasmodium brasilianum TaxID=5824 RepID=A0ACB9YAW1_PLABR|nr:serpentine receptor 1 [Plasmodium brasilianum]